MDPFSKDLGVEVTEVNETLARATLKLEERHLTNMGVAHGAALYGLAHVAFAALCQAQDVDTILALDANVSFLYPAREGEELTAEARVNHTSRRFTICDVGVNNERGRIAEFRGRAYVPDE